jgi:hypothetical protein
VEEIVSEIVCREEELASVFALIDDMREGPFALVLEGEAGVFRAELPAPNPYCGF